MAQYEETNKTKPQVSKELFRRWRDARQSWDLEARDAVDFVLGNHFTAEESNALASVGQADFVIDRVYAAVDKLKSLLTGIILVCLNIYILKLFTLILFIV